MESTNRKVTVTEIRDEAGKVPTFAWPGGYPLVYVTDDGEVLCSDCVNDPTNPVHETGEADGWRIDGYQIHYEGPAERCAHCNKEIPSAYGTDVRGGEMQEQNAYDGRQVEMLSGERIRQLREDQDAATPAQFQVYAVYPSGHRYPVGKPHANAASAEWHRELCERRYPDETYDVDFADAL